MVVAFGEDASVMLDLFHPILESSGLRRSEVRRIELGGRAYALFRDATGTPAALLDVCPHRHAPLSLGRVRVGALACPYHGWTFDGEGRGHNPSQPSLRGCDVESLQVAERHGLLWVAGRQAPPEAVPRLEVPGSQELGVYSRSFEVPLHVLLSNFVDVEHVPFIHSPGIGLLSLRFGPPGELRTEVGPDEVKTTYRYRADAEPGARFLAWRSIRMDVERVTRFDPLRLADTVTWHDEQTGRQLPMSLRIVSFFVPETRERTRVSWYASMACSTWLLRRLGPVLRRGARPLLQLTTRQDERFLRACAHIPYETDGMRLDRLDGPISANLRALQHTRYRSMLKLGNPGGAIVTVQGAARGPR